ncbi:MAG: serine hydrolase domain-containing protein [Planctomycetota bacterium]|nr:serine hydrolase domain-containing protein [Planctomycetota bacterium]
MTKHFSVFLLFSLALTCLPATAKDLPVVQPEKVGLSSSKLEKVDKVVEGLVASNRIAGATVIILRHGRVAYFKAFGEMDRERKKPMQKDTIFRIYSMTKAIVTAGAMMLWEEKKFGLDDPLSMHLPEYKNPRVWTKDGVVPARQEVTPRDLMRHTAGMVYGHFGGTPVHRATEKAIGFKNGFPMETLATSSKKFGAVPLLFHPGDDWVYGVSIDVLGRLIEVKSGLPLDRFLKERIFKPLDMKDTGFFVPTPKIDRFASNYTTDGKGQLTLRDDARKSPYLRNPVFLSGGGGLVSTTRDYARFLQLIANGGRLNKTRLLKKKTVAMMIRNHVPAKAMPIAFGEQERHGIGFGLGFAVRTATSTWDSSGRLGEYGWGGAASTHYWTSPKDKLVVVTMEQTMPYDFLLEFALKGVIYDAIIK